MLWYEHLMGILAIFTCINWVVIIAAIRVSAVADYRGMGDFSHAWNHEFHELTLIIGKPITGKPV